MKIKNDYVKIKAGEKIYEFKNMILNNYIQQFITRSISQEETSKLIKFNYILLKLDTPIGTLSYDMEINKDIFNIILKIDKTDYEQELNKTSMSITYSVIKGQYDSLDYPLGQELNIFNNRKICNIAFAYASTEKEDAELEDTTIGAIIDTSNYDIYIQENETLSIVRRDIITTDAEFYSNNKYIIPFPAHLAPALLNNIIREPDVVGATTYSFNRKCSGFLYSIGLSIDGKGIEKEYIVGEDVEPVIEGNTIKFLSILNKNEKELIYLGNDGNIYLGHLYITSSRAKYITLKYKVMQLVNTGTYNQLEQNYDLYQIPTYTGYYYTLTFPIEIEGNMTLKIKYERGE